MTAEFVDVDDFVDERFIGDFPDGEYIEEDEEYFPLPLIADVVERAAVIVGEGWTQGRPFAMTDGCRLACANGALWLATGFTLEDGLAAAEFTVEEGLQTSPRKKMFDAERHELFLAAVEMLSAFVGQPSFAWNDAPGRSKEQVVYTMLELAKKLREE